MSSFFWLPPSVTESQKWIVATPAKKMILRRRFTLHFTERQRGVCTGHAGEFEQSRGFMLLLLCMDTFWIQSSLQKQKKQQQKPLSCRRASARGHSASLWGTRPLSCARHMKVSCYLCSVSLPAPDVCGETFIFSFLKRALSQSRSLARLSAGCHEGPAFKLSVLVPRLSHLPE